MPTRNRIQDTIFKIALKQSNSFDAELTYALTSKCKTLAKVDKSIAL